MFFLLACNANMCGEEGALSICSEPTLSADYYEDQSLRYFDTLESDFVEGEQPVYAEGVARWEWPPWLKLTGLGREDMAQIDAIVRLIETYVPERECTFFEEQPFGRCHVSFTYASEPDQGCPIYEEFTFNDAGEITFIEAWADNPAYLPEDVAGARLSTRIPGLGTASGALDLEGEAMQDAAEKDPDVADFVTRAQDFYGTWLEEYQSASEDVFAAGCGWK